VQLVSATVILWAKRAFLSRGIQKNLLPTGVGDRLILFRQVTRSCFFSGIPHPHLLGGRAPDFFCFCFSAGSSNLITFPTHREECRNYTHLSPPVQGATVLHRLARLYKIAIQGATRVLQNATKVLHFRRLPWLTRVTRQRPSVLLMPVRDPPPWRRQSSQQKEIAR
jgi:hypothetical protein